jgi:hypothetical protein
VISRKTSDNSLRIWQFDSSWNYVMSEALNNFDNGTVVNLEQSFQSDLDGNSLLDLDLNGSTTLSVDPVNKYLLASGQQLLFNGDPMLSTRYAQTFIGAENVDGINRVLMQKSDGSYRTWCFDLDWSYQTTEFVENLSLETQSQMESAFSVSFDS